MSIMHPHTILIFESDNEDQQHTLKLMQHAGKMHISISEIIGIFRGHLKYNRQNLTEKELDIVEKIRSEVIEKLEENNVLHLID